MPNNAPQFRPNTNGPQDNHRSYQHDWLQHENRLTSIENAIKALGNKSGSGSSSGSTTVVSGSGGGSVTTFSAAFPSGFTVNVTNPTTTPQLVVQTSLSGLLMVTAGAFVAAVPGTDYVASAAAGTGITRAGTLGAYTFSLTQTAVVGEAPSGAIDGVNTSFTLAHSAVAGSVAIYMGATAGGLLSRVLPANYTVTGTALSFTVAPAAGQSILADYRF